MRVEFHPSVRQDVAEATRRYKSVSDRLAEELKAELRRVIRIAATHPNRFHLIRPGLHRANLKRFPYHFLYRTIPGGIQVMLLRHHRQHQETGLERD